MNDSISRVIKGMLVLAFCLMVACSSPSPTSTPATTPTLAPTPKVMATPVTTPTPTVMPAPTPESLADLPPDHGMMIDTSEYGAATAGVGERIYASDVVVVARLVSSTDGVLTFRAIEYLKGTGASQFTVPASAGGDATWDNQDAVLFLTTGSGGVSGSGGASERGASGNAAVTFQFTDTTVSTVAETREYKGHLPEGNTADSRNPVWVPSTGSGKSGEGGARGASVDSGGFITHGKPSETFTLADLKAKIAWMDSEGRSESYKDCVKSSLYDERAERDFAAYYPGFFDFPINVTEIESGAAAGTFVYGYPDHAVIDNEVGSKSWLEGSGKDLFRIPIVDDDGIVRNGFGVLIETARPIPGGTYRIDWYYQLSFFVACDYMQGTRPSEHQIVVKSPAGTVYEAIFDPVAIG